MDNTSGTSLRAIPQHRHAGARRNPAVGAHTKAPTELDPGFRRDDERDGSAIDG